jgi:hypothetical protein
LILPIDYYYYSSSINQRATSEGTEKGEEQSDTRDEETIACEEQREQRREQTDSRDGRAASKQHHSRQ